LGLLSDRFARKAVLLPSCLLLGLFFALLAVAPPGIPLGLMNVASVFFHTLFNTFNAAVMDVAGSNVQAAIYGLTALITQLVIIPAPMITGCLIGGLGIKFASSWWEYFCSSPVWCSRLCSYTGARRTHNGEFGFQTVPARTADVAEEIHRGVQRRAVRSKMAASATLVGAIGFDTV
jgi:MFS family permease